MMTWDELFIKLAFINAQKSKDPSTKVGCVIVGQDNAVLSMGFNGFPRGVKETTNNIDIYDESGLIVGCASGKLLDRWNRPEKYSWVEHAERNAIYNAARHGICTLGAKAYLNFEPHPCADCTRALIQAGIVEIIGPNIPFSGVGSGTNYHLGYAKTMCEEAGVKLRIVDWEVAHHPV